MEKSYPAIPGGPAIGISSPVTLDELRALLPAAAWNSERAIDAFFAITGADPTGLHEFGAITGQLFRRSTELQEAFRLETIVSRILRREPTTHLMLADACQFLTGLIDGVDARFWIDFPTHRQVIYRAGGARATVTNSLVRALRRAKPGHYETLAGAVDERIAAYAASEMRAQAISIHHLGMPGHVVAIMMIGTTRETPLSASERAIIERVVATTRDHLRASHDYDLPGAGFVPGMDGAGTAGLVTPESMRRWLARIEPYLDVVALLERPVVGNRDATIVASAGDALPGVPRTALDGARDAAMQTSEPYVLHHLQHAPEPVHAALIHVGCVDDRDRFIVLLRQRAPFRDRDELRRLVHNLPQLSDPAHASHGTAARNRPDPVTLPEPSRSPARPHRLPRALRETARVMLDTIPPQLPRDHAVLLVPAPGSTELVSVAARPALSVSRPVWTLPGDAPVWGEPDQHRPWTVMTLDELVRQGLEGHIAIAEDEARFLVGVLQRQHRQVGLVIIGPVEPGGPDEGMIGAFATWLQSAALTLDLANKVESTRSQRDLAQELSAVTALFNSARTHDSIVETLQQGVARLLDIDHSHIALHHADPAGRVLIYLSHALSPDRRAPWFGDDPASLPIEREILAAKHTIAGERMRQLVSMPPYASPSGATGLAAVPIWHGAHMDGVLYLWTPLPPDDPDFRDLSTEKLTIARSLCAQAAAALERARLHEAAERTAARQAILGTLAERLSAAATAADMVDRALNAFKATVPFGRGRVMRFLPESQAWTLLGYAAQTPPFDDTHLGAVTALELSVATTATSWDGQLGDWDGEHRLAGREVAELYAVCWPLIDDGVVLGVVTLLRQGRVPFTAADGETIAAVSGQLALALRRAESLHAALEARTAAEQLSSALTELLRISSGMSVAQDIPSLLTAMSDGLTSLVPFISIAVYQADDTQAGLKLLHFRSSGQRQVSLVTIPPGHGPIGAVAQTAMPRETSASELPTDEYPFTSASKEQTASVRLLVQPMVIEGELVGVMALEIPSHSEIGDDERSMLQIFSVQAGAALRNARLMQQKRELYLGGIRALTSAVDAKDPFNHGHSARVGQLSRRIAEEMRIGSEEAIRIELAALLHDIGKIGIPDAILHKPKRLNSQERAVMMGHAELGARILRDARSSDLNRLTDLVRHHHEWWDGCGYPDRLAGEDIPLGARIIAVADAFDTITTDRPYRKHRSLASARAILRDGAGTQFDPGVIEAVERLASNGRLPRHVVSDPGPKPEPGTHVGLPEDPGAGQLGDMRWLGLLVDLAHATSHMTNLHNLLEQLTGLLAEHFGFGYVGFRVFTMPQGAGVLVERDRSQVVRRQTGVDTSWIVKTLAGELPASLRDTGVSGTDMQWPTVTLRNTGVQALVCDEVPVGVVIFRPKDAQRTWKADAAAMEAISSHLAAAINLARLHESAVRQATTDGLTGVLNHRGFYQLLGDSIERAAPFTLLMFDVISLKRVNDSQGHLAGDRLLMLVAECIASTTGEPGRVARYGGDEFAVVLDGEVDAEGIATDIQQKLQERSLAELHDRINVRCGWSSYPRDGREAERLVDIADQRMYGRGSLTPAD